VTRLLAKYLRMIDGEVKASQLAVGNEFSYRSPHVVLNQFDDAAPRERSQLAVK